MCCDNSNDDHRKLVGMIISIRWLQFLQWMIKKQGYDISYLEINILPSSLSLYRFLSYFPSSFLVSVLHNSNSDIHSIISISFKYQ